MEFFLKSLSQIASLLSVCIATCALYWSFVTYRRNVKMSSYSELDRMYADLLSLAIGKTHLRRDPSADRTDSEKEDGTDSEKEEYHIYAYMVWNFIETVHDRIYKHVSTEGLSSTKMDAFNNSWIKSLLAFCRSVCKNKWFDDFRAIKEQIFDTYPTKDLCETWGKVIYVEYALLGDWFQKYLCMFKPSFGTFINDFIKLKQEAE